MAFLAAGFILACGKKNTAEVPINSSPNGINNPISVAGGSNCSGRSMEGAFSFAEFANQVASCQFSVASQKGAFITYKKYTGVADPLNFQVNDNSGFSFDFNFCFGSDCFDAGEIIGRRLDQNLFIYRSANFSIDSEFGNNLQALLNNLVSKMRVATNIKKCFFTQCDSESSLNFNYGNIKSTRYYFESGNRAYIVDTQFPLIANPVGIYDKDKKEVFVVQF